ncbi:hypothetical protein [Deinococcus aestuarii]|uniref:hypothetical protein n=1 Tax=Deinococcus aestuarii TaxID=2774531 RepID=UPI001C0CE871|nr:hypothetical protein [Deinococcus aestuarii]
MPKRLLLSAALFALLSTPALAQATPPTPEQAAQVIERLLPGVGDPNVENEITYGTLPPSLPLRLDGRFEVLAALRTTTNRGQFVTHRIFLRTDLPADQAQEALRRVLTGGGWRALPGQGQPFGFVSPQAPSSSAFYREGEPNFILNANSAERGGKTELDLNLNVVPREQIESFQRLIFSVPRSSLPSLKPLPGATIRVGYTQNFPNGTLSSAHVQTDRSANEVFSFYSAQLKAAGWKARTDTTDGPLRVVTYSLTDLNGREALGTLGLRPWEKEGGYVLTVSVQGFKP